jgi:hypothetical protein
MKNYIVCLLLLLSLRSFGQNDLGTEISKQLKAYKPDTTSLPGDKTTKLIIELRQLRGNFNIDEVVQLRLQEEMSKGNNSGDLQKMVESFSSGDGKRWLDNAVMHLYREQFSYADLKKMTRFYKTSAGQKMAKAFPLIIMKSLAASEMIQQSLSRKK